MDLKGPDLNLKFALPLWRELGSFWSWWTGVLLGMLPGEIRRRILPGAIRLYLDWEDGEVVASMGTAESHREVARYATRAGAQEPDKDHHFRIGRARNIVFCLPRDKVLLKQFTLPLAAEENLREVLGFELDRETPFTAEQVYYDAIVLERRPREHTLALQLILTPRQALDAMLARIGNLGFQPQQVTVRDTVGNPLIANLLPPQERGRSTDKVKYINLALGTVALLLLIVVVSLPLVHKARVIHTLESAVDIATEKADLASKLREKVDQLNKGSRFLVDKKQSTPLRVGTVAELTRILPDDTWVTRLDIKGSEVQIQGQSASAAALIPLLESSPELHNARFRSPVTQTRHAKTKERFHLSVETVSEAGS
jgi:general secretion pathway protein L